MAKIIRNTYPKEFSIGLLLLVFVLASFLSFEIFEVKWGEIMAGGNQIIGMMLAGLAVVLMALILWEEFLFPVRFKPAADEIIFRNHATKLQTQVAIYCAIPVIVAFVFFNYVISPVPFSIWATVCLVAPVAGKLASGVKNYNDFLKLTNETIEFKNNEKEGALRISEIKEIVLIRDDENILHKVKVQMLSNTEVMIDLDEMELEAYCDTIDKFITGHYSMAH